MGVAGRDPGCPVRPSLLFSDCALGPGYFDVTQTETSTRRARESAGSGPEFPKLGGVARAGPLEAARLKDVDSRKAADEPGDGDPAVVESTGSRVSNGPFGPIPRKWNGSDGQPDHPPDSLDLQITRHNHPGT